MGNASLGAFTGYADDNTVNNLQEAIEISVNGFLRMRANVTY